MTILEVENLTGIDRGTVRYYEKEALISPAREANGYRNYSEADVGKLKKIKLLRALDFSIDDIRAMEEDAADFPERVEARIRSLGAKAEDLEDARRVLERMLSDGAEYASLNSNLYLTELEGGRRMLEGAGSPASELPALTRPGMWRRLFARSFDLALCRFFVYGFIAIVLHRNVEVLSGRFWPHVLIVASTLLLLLFLEPLFLSRFGVTPGKWLLGITVTDDRGGRLNYIAALDRTFDVLFFGYGFQIPLINLWRGWVTFRTLIRDEEPDWEWTSVIGLSRKSALGTASFIAAVGVLAGLFYVTERLPERTPNTGALTKAEYAENVNYLSAYNNYNGYSDLLYNLKSDLSWAILIYPEISNDPDPRSWFHMPDVSAIETDGEITKLTISCYVESNDYRYSSVTDTQSGGNISMIRHIEIMEYAALAFLEAQEDFSVFSGDAERVRNYVGVWDHDYSFEMAGVTVTYEITMGNCYYGGGSYLIPNYNGERPWVSYTLTLEKG